MAVGRERERKRANPNVAALPAIYWPKLRSMPFGPGPFLTMLYPPKMKPMHSPTPVNTPTHPSAFCSSANRNVTAESGSVGLILKIVVVWEVEKRRRRCTRITRMATRRWRVDVQPPIMAPNFTA